MSKCQNQKISSQLQQQQAKRSHMKNKTLCAIQSNITWQIITHFDAQFLKVLFISAMLQAAATQFLERYKPGCRHLVKRYHFHFAVSQVTKSAFCDEISKQQFSLQNFF